MEKSMKVLISASKSESSTGDYKKFIAELKKQVKAAQSNATAVAGSPEKGEETFRSIVIPKS
jgi:hypothetical protein